MDSSGKFISNLQLALTKETLLQIDLRGLETNAKVFEMKKLAKDLETIRTYMG